MKRSLSQHSAFIGISPCTKGFGFAVLEARGRLVSWGVARLYSSSNEEFQQRLEALIVRYGIALLCLDDLAGQHRRGRRARTLYRHAAGVARRTSVPTSLISRNRVLECLGLEARATKYEVAVRVTELFPELVDALPPPRKPWHSEDARIALFIAVSLAAVHRCRNDEAFVARA